MIITKQKIASAFTAGVILLSTVSPAFAATTLEISGNGSSSDNTIRTTTNTTTTVVQSNEADIRNNVDTNANTGGNYANDNTGGSVFVGTGNTTSNVDILNRTNINRAQLDNCGCETSSTDVTISGNGSSSDNTINLSSNKDNSVFQENEADIRNDVDSYSNTGENNASRNTGGETGGDVTVLTGNSRADVILRTDANANIVQSLTSVGNGGSGQTNIEIVGNGSGSDNRARVTRNQSATVVQENEADVRNDVDTYANTGRNRANDNTNQDVLIDTGSVTENVLARTRVNFNFANPADCGCVTDLTALISGNGSGSDNLIRHSATKGVEVFQGGEDSGNEADIRNDVDVDGSTGRNYASRNTGAPEGTGFTDILTGLIRSMTEITNTGNANIYGTGFDLDWDFDLASLL
jgi:hypothetical protein